MHNSDFHRIAQNLERILKPNVRKYNMHFKPNVRVINLNCFVFSLVVLKWRLSPSLPLPKIIEAKAHA